MNSQFHTVKDFPSPFRVLIVEDDEDDYILAESYLKQAYGDTIAISWAASYEAGLKLSTEQQFDLFIIDYMLGEKTGIQLTQHITADAFVVNPVILLTGMDNHQVDVEATEAGAMDYLVKQDLDAALLERSIRYALKRKIVEEKLIALAQHDPLTGLANRTKFNIILSEKIQQARRNNHSFAVLLLDLDQFKEINDTLGHFMGDSLLKLTAKRLQEQLRDVDTVARLGGDEFAIIADFNNVADGSAQLAERINEALAEPFAINGNELQITSSIGITIYPNDGATPEALLKSADLAMYKSKRNGRNTYCYFDPEFEQELNQLKKLKAELSRAIINNEFVLHYQPIINSNSNTIDKAEALIRWQHPSKGLLSPYHFIDVAEKTHLIEAIGDWVLHQAIQDCARWSQIENLHHIGVSINLSAHQFSEGHLSAKIKRELENHHFGHGKVTLEITETAIMETGEPLFQQLQEFSQLGIDIAIDDFGTGYSSLSYLKQLPVGILKVDRSFVSDIDHDEDDRIISKAIINLGHSLNKSIIAEGIETKEQLDMIRQYGCHLIQGYYYAKPMPWDEFVNWCSQFQQTKS